MAAELVHMLTAIACGLTYRDPLKVCDKNALFKNRTGEWSRFLDQLKIRGLYPKCQFYLSKNSIHMESRPRSMA